MDVLENLLVYGGDSGLEQNNSCAEDNDHGINIYLNQGKGAI